MDDPTRKLNPDYKEKQIAELRATTERRRELLRSARLIIEHRGKRAVEAQEAMERQWLQEYREVAQDE